MGKTRSYSDREKLDEALGSEGRAKVQAELDRTNWRRARIYLGAVLAFEAILLVLVDIPSIRASLEGGPGMAPKDSPLGRGEPLWLPLSFMVLHLGMLLTAAAGLLAAYRGLKRSRPSEWAITIVASISLFFLGAIGGLDQLRSGDINSWTLSVIVISIMFNIRWPLNLLAFLPSSLALATGILVFQANEAQIVTHLVNIGIYSISIIFLSTFLYGSQYSLRANSTLLEKANAQLDHLSHHDPLTGLPNRRAFTAIFDRELGRLRREGGGIFIAVCDIDSFKKLNDREGHPAGDQVLREVAAVLAASLRPTDAVARWGGEEFLILLNGESEGGAAEALERIRRSVEALRIDWNGRSLAVTLSFGFADIRADEADPLSEAYERADSALYRAKGEGKNTVRKG